MEHKNEEKWIKGRRGGAACLTVTTGPDGLIHISGEAEHVTQNQVRRWARKNYRGCRVIDAYFGDGYVGVKVLK